MFTNMKNEFELFKKDYEENKFEVCIFGAGRGAYWAIKLLNKYNIPIKFIIDKNNNVKTNNLNAPIITLDEFLKSNKNMNFRILISSPKYEYEIKAELEKNIGKSKIYSFECELYCSSISNITEYKRYLDENYNQIRKIYLKLEDEFSRKTLENILKGRVSGKLKYFMDVFVQNQYFCEDIIKLNDKEIILDVGANYGDTLEDIVKQTNKKFERIYCFEPDEKCLDSLKEITQNLQLDNVVIINKGAWDKSERLSFASDSTHGASKIVSISQESHNELQEIETIAIDDIVEDNVTFIKMDIEGAEMKALKGAERTIKRHKPKLAICVYHKNEDILDIYKYITNLVPEYKIYLRHHNVSGTETVLYATL